MDSYVNSSQNDRALRKKSECVSNYNYQMLRQSTGNVRNNITEAQTSSATAVSPDDRDYLDEKKIAETFQFLISHLIVDRPSNPIEYLFRLIDDCILFRSRLKEPRLLWTERHVDSVFRSIDSSNLEFISLVGYNTAMKILGVRSYNPCPVSEYVTGCVAQQTFCTEALKSLENELAEITNETTH